MREELHVIEVDGWVGSRDEFTLLFRLYIIFICTVYTEFPAQRIIFSSSILIHLHIHHGSKTRLHPLLLRHPTRTPRRRAPIRSLRNLLPNHRQLTHLPSTIRRSHHQPRHQQPTYRPRRKDGAGIKPGWSNRRRRPPRARN